MSTLKDVAAAAGVSTATASLALNQGKVKEATRQRVLQCAEALNYIPNRIGRILTTGRSHIVEFLIMTSGRYADTVRQTALFYYLLEGALAAAHEQNYTVRFDVRSHDDPGLGRYFEHAVGDNLLDGIIIVPQYSTDFGFIEPLMRADFPFVLLCPKRFAGRADHVDMGNREGGRMVGDLFVSLGCRAPAVIGGPPSHVDSVERVRGFAAGLRSGGVAEFRQAFGDFTIESGYAAMRDLLAVAQPDAVFCANDYMAAGALKHLYEVGLRVPGDVSVVGYDNSDVARAVTPSLTSVDNHFVQLGRELAESLLDRIRGRSSACRRLVTPALVSRESHLMPAPGERASPAGQRKGRSGAGRR